MSAVRRPSAGLDFGTSTTLYATSRADVVAIGRGRNWMPSLIGYDWTDKPVAGEDAEALDAMAPGSVKRSVKRCITEGIQLVSLIGPEGSRQMRADDLVADLLREAWIRATGNFSTLSESSVFRLGCPAMWDAPRRRRLLTAAQQAGLPMDQGVLVDEPVAAGIAWLASRPKPPDHRIRIVVFDMGGGTLDIAVLDVRGTDVWVLAALGTAEAGDALDAKIASELGWMLAQQKIIRTPVITERQAINLHEQARRIKERLSVNDEEPLVLNREIFGRAAEIWYTRDQLELALLSQMDRAEETLELALRVAHLSEGAKPPSQVLGMSKSDLVHGVGYILLSGGMSHVPYIRQRLQGFFGPNTNVELAYERPEEAVVVGLAKASQYGRINVYRPPFDVVLEWGQGHETRTIYEAYTPLVGKSQIAGDSGEELRYVRRAQDLDIPTSGKGKLRIVSRSEGRLNATLGERRLHGYPVTFGTKFEFSIYPSGKIRFVDGAGIVFGQIDDWHQLDD